jgi:uncharacterized membrane protein
MLVTAGTAIFIRDFEIPNISGNTPIHLLIPFGVIMIYFALRRLFAGNIRAGVVN